MAMLDDLIAGMRLVKQFDNLPTDILVQIVKSGDIQQSKKDEILFHEGHLCSGLFVLIKGQVGLCKIGPEGQMSLLTILDPVIMFNEVAALDGGMNPVSSIALSDVTLWKIGFQKFQNLIRQVPELGLSLLHILARRNRLLISHYDDLSFRTIEARLAKYLIELSDQGKKTIVRKDLPVKVVAARIVTSPEAVSRTLRRFKEASLIECDRQVIAIINLPGLIDLAQISF